MNEMTGPKHAGRGNERNRAPYDEIMAGLPRNQSGEETTRHAYPICFYEQGKTDGRAELANDVMLFLSQVR